MGLHAAFDQGTRYCGEAETSKNECACAKLKVLATLLGEYRAIAPGGMSGPEQLQRAVVTKKGLWACPAAATCIASG